MLLRSKLISSLSVVTLLMNTAIFAETMGGETYSYQPNSMLNGNFYAGLNIGYSRLHLGLSTPSALATTPLAVKSKSIDSFIFGGEIGYAFDHNYTLPVRLGLNLNFRPSKDFNLTPITYGSDEYGNAQIQSTVILLNGYYDFYNSTGYIPYFGLGAGLNRNKFTLGINKTATNATVNSAANSNNDSFAWDAAMGVWTTLASNLKSDLSLRFTHLGKPAALKSKTLAGVVVTNALVEHLYSVDVGFSLRYDFV